MQPLGICTFVLALNPPELGGLSAEFILNMEININECAGVLSQKKFSAKYLECTVVGDYNVKSYFE